MPLRPGEPFGRYRVEALLGEGGMGQVYRAVDELLRRPVALKVLSAAAHRDAGPGLAERLLREARAAAAIEHPNAVAIFDVGDVEGVPFLAMELVEGKTLRHYVAGTTPLPQRLQWLLSIARALAAAHKRGLVHRDIKPENVMVRADGHAKVLDFGIARPMTPAWSESSTAGGPSAVSSEAKSVGKVPARPVAVPLTSASLAAASPLSVSTGDSAAVGTPLYMSPEQLTSAPLDGRSDQFAWGVVAWELLVGRLPWTVDRGAPTAMGEILGRDPARVETVVPDVSPEVGAVVARALAKKVRDRFETTDGLVEALERALHVAPFAVTTGRNPGSVSPTAHTVPENEVAGARTPELAVIVRTEPRRRRTAAMAVAVTLTVVGAGLGVAAWRGRSTQTADAARLAMVVPGRRPALAVMADPGLSGPLAAFPELVAAELATGDQIRVVPRDVVARIVTGGPLDGAALAKVRAVANADGVLRVKTSSDPSKLALVLTLLDAGGGVLEQRDVTVAGAGDLAEAVSRTGGEVRRLLGRAPLAPGDAAALRAALPRSAVAAEAYAVGLAARSHYAYGAAKDAFQRAVKEEDDFALAHLELARSLAGLGFDAEARAEAARAVELSVALPREQRLVVDAQHAVTTKDWGAASEAYRTLFGFFPDNLDYGLGLVRSLVLGGKRDEGLATLDRLRAVPRTAMEEARVDAMESFAAAKVGDIPRRLASAERAKAKADTLGAAWIAADARVSISEAKRDLGQAGGDTDLDEARGLYEQLGDLSGLAGVYRQKMERASMNGDVPQALAFGDKAIALARQVGDQYRLGGLITGRAIVLAHAGDFVAAEKGFDESRALYESIHDTEGVAHNTGNAAEVRLQRGDLTGAREAFQRALALHTQIGMRMGMAGQRLNLAWLAYLEGDLKTAKAGAEQALAEARAIQSTGQVWEALTRLALVLRAGKDAAGAGKALEEASNLAGHAGDLDAKAEIDLRKALLALDGHQGAEAERLARTSLARFVEAKTPYLEALARALLVRALAQEGSPVKSDEARAEARVLEASLPSLQHAEAKAEAKTALDLIRTRTPR